jgi:hypothetical protein
MKRSSSALMLLVCGSLVFAACKKSEDPAPVPIPTGSASPTPIGVGSDAPAADTAAPSAAVTAAPTPPVAVAPVNQQPIDACCSALASVSKSGRSPDTKSKAALGSKICSGIAPLVKSGKTTRVSALSTIRAQLSGIDIPAECR